MSNELAKAFMAPSMPCNPLPFLQSLYDGVKQNGTGWIESDEAKAIMQTVLNQMYGQLFNVNALSEYDRLKNIIK